MSKIKIISLTALVLIGAMVLRTGLTSPTAVSVESSGAPPYSVEDPVVPDLVQNSLSLNWERPNVPPKVALQIGHWKNDELPEELSRLIGNTGAHAAGVTEVAVNRAVAEATAELLMENGITVEILPATVPPRYWADVFVAIHADGSPDTTVSGYKVAGPWRDVRGKSRRLVTLIEEGYEAATRLPKDPNITRNMRGYYAFSWWRFEHAVHPMTTAVILETGFLTNPGDRRMLVEQPEVSATALAAAILEFLQAEGITT